MSFDEIRRNFMEQMDALWMHQFDKAFRRIPEDSALAYKRYADYLDKLFVCYWNFLVELHKKEGTTNDKLVKVAAKQYADSKRHAEKVWWITTDAQAIKAEKLKKKRKCRKAAKRHLATLELGLTLLKEARDTDTMEERWPKYRHAAGVMGDFLKKVGKHDK